MAIKKSQISLEYLIIVGFVSFVIIGILGIALIYSGSVKDRIKLTQLENFANKVVTGAESVFYSGEPSKITISAYLPENVEEITISDYSLIFSIQTNSGVTRVMYTSKVPVTGIISTNSGLKRIQITAEETRAVITQA